MERIKYARRQAYSNSLMILQNSILQINRISMVKWQDLQFNVPSILYREPPYCSLNP